MIEIPKQPWLERAKNKLTDLFEGRRNLAFTFDVMESDLFVGLEHIAASKANKCQTILDHRLDLQNQIHSLHRRFEIGYEDDRVYSLQPYTGVGLFASAFGCKTQFPEIGDPITHSVISSIDQVDRLHIDIKKADLVELTLNKIKYFLDETSGEVPISFPDIQSPLDAASIVLDYTELMCAMLTVPDKVHSLLKMITDVIEETLATVTELLPDRSPSADAWLPQGIWLSDDLMAVISPDQYAEFALPYNNRLSEKYGGIIMHSCGNPLATVDVLRQHKNLMGLDFWEETIAAFQKRGGDYLCVCPVVEDAWHNLDRREARKDKCEAINDALEDLKKLKNHLQTPVLFTGICPHHSCRDEYYDILASTAKDAEKPFVKK